MEIIYSHDQNGFYRFHQATLDSNIATYDYKMHTNAFFKETVHELFTDATKIFVGFGLCEI